MNSVYNSVVYSWFEVFATFLNILIRKYLELLCAKNYLWVNVSVAIVCGKVSLVGTGNNRLPVGGRILNLIVQMCDLPI